MEDVIDNILVESLSPQHLQVMKALKKPKKDLDLAKELGLEDTQVRVILNDLHERKLVCYTRTKNDETGWVTHYWRKRDDQLTTYTQGYLKKKISKINYHLKDDTTKIMFSCGCKQVSYEKAIDDSFQCNDCQQSYVEYNDPAAVEEKVVELTRLNSLLQELT